MPVARRMNFYKGKRIIVTGHTGFIGSWLTKWLTMLDADICGYALEPPSRPNIYDVLDLSEEIRDIRGDIRDTELLRKTISSFYPEIVFHLAAQPIVLKSYDNPVTTFDTNVTGTVNLLNELRKADSVKTIIVMTSDKSYRNKDGAYPYRENDELGGKDPYSASKSCQDIIVSSFRDSFFSQVGVGVSSIRAGNVIGGGDWANQRIVPDLVRSIVANRPVEIRYPEAIRPWQHVLEPISGILDLTERMQMKMEFAGAWNFGPENNAEITVKELAETFIHYWGKGEYTIEPEVRNKEEICLKLDINKAKRELGWLPRYTFQKAVSETVKWYKTYYNNLEDIKPFTEKEIKHYSFLI